MDGERGFRHLYCSFEALNPQNMTPELSGLFLLDAKLDLPTEITLSIHMKSLCHISFAPKEVLVLKLSWAADWAEMTTEKFEPNMDGDDFAIR